MGAVFNFEQLEATNDRDAKKEVESLICQARYEYGHGGYTGSFAEVDGCLINKSFLFDSIFATEEWLGEHAEKWGPAIIVLTKDGIYCVGAICSS